MGWQDWTVEQEQRLVHAAGRLLGALPQGSVLTAAHWVAVARVVNAGEAKAHKHKSSGACKLRAKLLGIIGG